MLIKITTMSFFSLPAEEKLNKPIFIPGKPSSREQREKEAQEAREAAPPKEVEVSTRI